MIHNRRYGTKEMKASQQKGDFGVTCRRWIPFSWRARDESASQPERLSALNQANDKRLKKLLEYETRDNPSPEFASLESLILELVHEQHHFPVSHSVILSAHSLQWIDTSAQTRIKEGDVGLATLYLNPELPYKVEFLAEIQSVTKEDDPPGWRIKANLAMRSEPVVDLYEQLIFIYYRRERREKKLASGEELSH